MSKILIISTTLRNHINSEFITEKMAKGIREAGHEVETVSLKGKNLKFWTGCLVCQKIQKCVLNDDAFWIAERVKMADNLVFSTPVCHCDLSGQMKRLLDRMNSLYPSDYQFPNIWRSIRRFEVFHRQSVACFRITSLEVWESHTNKIKKYWHGVRMRI